MAKRASKQGAPKVGYFIQSRGPGGGVEFEEVYVYGPTRRSDEGIVGHDLQMRPTRLGPGDYTFVASPDDVEWTRPVSAPTKRSSAQIKREIDEILTGKPRSHASVSRDRAAELIAGYGAWKSTYSNEDFDRAQHLAQELTDIDRQEGHTAPSVGYSTERFRQASQVVKDTNLYGEHQQQLSARSRRS